MLKPTSLAPAICALLLTGTASAQYTLVAELEGAQQVPSNASPGKGTATFHVDAVANTIAYQVTIEGLLGGETAAHVHGYTAPGINAGILFSLPVGAHKAGVLSYSETDEGSLLAGLAYINIHSTAFPGGEIRGQMIQGGGDAVLTGVLDGAQSLGGSTSTAKGTAFFSVDMSTNTVSYQATLTSGQLLGAETAAHIHGYAPPGAGAGVQHTMPLGSHKKGAWVYPSSEEASLLASLSYINVHTAAFPAGEIRGQMVLSSSNVLFRGLMNSSLGQAILQPTAQDRLSVSNLGSSGLDGVSVRVTQTDRADLEFAPLVATAFPMTATLLIEAFGTVNGVPGEQSLMTFRTVRSGGRWLTTPDFSALGASTYAVRIYDESKALVYESLGNLNGTGGVDAPIITAVYQNGPNNCWDPDDPCTFWGHLGTLFKGDIAELVPINPSVAYELTRIDYRFLDFGSVEIVDEAIHAFGQAHSGVGAARLDPSTGLLTVSNLGSSGLDGVRVSLDPALGFDADLGDLELPAGSPLGATVVASTAGTLSGIPNASAGESSVVKTAQGYSIAADYSSLGAATQLIEVYDDGALVAAVPGPAPVLAPSWPTGYGYRDWPCADPYFAWAWSQDQTLSVAGAGNVVGDELRISAENPVGVLEHLTGSTLLASGVELRITGETHLPAGSYVAYCPSGTSGSGCQALLEAGGVASASAPSGFVVTAVSVEGAKDGLFFYGQNGRQQNPWGTGTSFACVAPPVKRGGLLTGTGTSGACDGSFFQDLNARWCPTCPSPAQSPAAGTPMQVQLWYRDPFNTSNQTTSFSNAIEVPVLP